MIKVVRLNGEVLYLNYFQIECMESIPETKIRMMNGSYYLVNDTVDSIIQQVNAFLCGNFALENRMCGERSDV
ncbi:flagellar FlbD family protein [Hungatella hathewayi]|uniref:flagellar FlbD family protein n=1 Tax=Hungatella hathewayi TaxID=154046 RepID=UPI003562419E